LLWCSWLAEGRPKSLGRGEQKEEGLMKDTRQKKEARSQKKLAKAVNARKWMELCIPFMDV
jgi:hypothetical protein